MELKLKTASSDGEAGIVLDEYGVLWKYSGPQEIHGIFLATTRGLNGAAIQGFYKSGTLFIVDASDAIIYFSTMNVENRYDLYHT